ncbi:MAG: ComF family protein [Deltaproteobacteria bacterium]|nr:ComF family protein [Deltaproteobacteria bacterium]
MSILLSCQKVFSSFIDIIYPPRCHICQSFLADDYNNNGTRPICQDCLNNFSGIESPFCPVCGTPFESMEEEDHLCEACLRKRPFYDIIAAPYLYEGGIMEAIHLLKYAGKTHLVESLGPLLASFALEKLDMTDGCLIMPVPLHPKRLRERGFNQSLLLARVLATLLDVELDFLSLRRIRYTQPQTGLKTDERRKNVSRAFELTEKIKWKGKTVILVDDVATTGNTLNECARVLKRAGCAKVFCLVLARASGF